MPKKTAVILFNLGGPDAPSAVKPFLFNLFNDPAIIRLPQPLRRLLAWVISRSRNREASKIYARLGGGSPIVPNTKAQARALERVLGKTHKVFVAMRYWHPRARTTLEDVKDYQPDQVVLLPLYPQYSTTTTASSFREWEALSQEEGFCVPTKKIHSYPTDPGFIQAICEKILSALEARKASNPMRLIFTAHGLPQKIVDQGDPYQRQVEETVHAIVKRLQEDHSGALDVRLAYQSRVGPMKWLTPSTESEIIRAGEEGVSLMLIPVAFVSEHSETLYELDIEYRELAQKKGVPEFIRLPTVADAPFFIEGLAHLVQETAESEGAEEA